MAQDENSSGVCDYCEFVIPQNLFSYCQRCRDQFAMAALTGIMNSERMLDNLRAEVPPAEFIAELARGSYRLADAMIKARKPSPAVPEISTQEPMGV